MQYPLFAMPAERSHQHPLTIRELPVSDQPGNRLKYLGSSSLSLRELLAVLIGGDSGLEMAERILRHAHSSAELASLTFSELTAVHGVGPSTAARIQAAFGLAQRIQMENRQELPQIHSPADIANLLMLEMGTRPRTVACRSARHPKPGARHCAALQRFSQHRRRACGRGLPRSAPAQCGIDCAGA